MSDDDGGGSNYGHEDGGRGWVSGGDERRRYKEEVRSGFRSHVSPYFAFVGHVGNRFIFFCCQLVVTPASYFESATATILGEIGEKILR